jgi:type I restriction enzyme S subunit
MKTTTKTGFKQTEVGMIPEHWEVKTLEESVERIIDHRGLTPLKLGGRWSKAGIRAISARNVKDGRLVAEDSINYVDEKLYGKWMPDEVKVNDILLTSEGPLGECLIWKSLEKIVLSQRIFGIRANSSTLNPEFLFWFMKSKAFQNQLSYRETGTTVQGIRQSELRRTKVVVPPLSEQKTVARILSVLDSKIELNQQMNKTLEAIGKAIFKHWFIDFEFPNEEGKPYKSSGGEMVYNQELGKEIPKGWRPGHLGDVAGNPRRGIQPEIVDRGTPYIGLEHMPRRSIALSDWGVVEEAVSNKFQFYSGDILFGKLRPYFHKVGVAPVDGVCSTDILVIVPKSRELFGLVLGHVSSTEFVNYVDAASTGTRMPRTNWGDMALYEILIPTDSLARAFNDTILPLLNRIKANILQSRTLTTIRDSLLPKLMSGKIRVPVEAR